MHEEYDDVHLQDTVSSQIINDVSRLVILPGIVY